MGDKGSHPTGDDSLNRVCADIYRVKISREENIPMEIILTSGSTSNAIEPVFPFKQIAKWR